MNAITLYLLYVAVLIVGGYFANKWLAGRKAREAAKESVPAVTPAPVVAPAPAPLTESELIALDPRWDVTRPVTTNTPPIAPPVVAPAPVAPAPTSEAELIATDSRWDLTRPVAPQVAPDRSTVEVVAGTPAPKVLSESELIALDSRWDVTRPVAPQVSTPVVLTEAEVIAAILARDKETP